jgi:hypothetical protein
MANKKNQHKPAGEAGDALSDIDPAQQSNAPGEAPGGLTEAKIEALGALGHKIHEQALEEAKRDWMHHEAALKAIIAESGIKTHAGISYNLMVTAYVNGKQEEVLITEEELLPAMQDTFLHKVTARHERRIIEKLLRQTK